MKKVAWFSGGVSSFIACYLCKETVNEIIYIDIDDQHTDTMRFLKDCESALNKEITVIKSSLSGVEDALRKSKFINSPYGAPCTMLLKKRVRQQWEKRQKEELIYIWGYDSEERNRADRLKRSMLEYDHIFPLIENNLVKSDAHALLERLNIKRPKMYELGYQNNNCIGCPKGGMGYWNKIRVDFPRVFEARAKLEREINATCIKGIFLDELEEGRGRFETEIMQECSIMCAIAYEKI